MFTFGHGRKRNIIEFNYYRVRVTAIEIKLVEIIPSTFR